MCYNIKALTEAQIKYAKHIGAKPSDYAHLVKLLEDLGPEMYYNVSGFSHPKVLTITQEQPKKPELIQWGLIPEWTKDESFANQIQNKTLNARSETVFEKASFKNIIQHHKCIVIVDGFFEHHHIGSNKYPFHVKRKDGEPMSLAGVYDTWQNPENEEEIKSFSIITTKGNELMTKIHNNPKNEEARMPLILEKKDHHKWLNSAEEKEIKSFFKINENELHAYTVPQINGKHSLGNTPKSVEEFPYFEIQMMGEFN